MIQHPEVVRQAAVSSLIRSCVAVLVSVLAVVLSVRFIACTPAKTVLDAGVAAVVDSTCTQIENGQGLPPDVVTVSCNAASEAGVAIVNVVLPRTAWEGIKASRLDAGGK